VATPSRLNKAQRDLLRQLGETILVENTPTSRSLLAKMKGMFS
jgi:molecular chaperone DnaJ